MRRTLLRAALRAALLAAGPLLLSPPLLLPFSGARAQTEVVLPNVRLGTGPIGYVAPRLVVRGSRLSQADLARIFDPASTEPLLERVLRLQADEILAPELVSEVETPQLKQRTVYRDVLLSRVGEGRIASVTSTGGTVESSQGGLTTAGTIGRMEVRDIDVGGAVAIFTQPAKPTDVLKPLYGSFTLDGMDLTDPSGVKTRIGRMSGRDFSAKPTRLGWLATLNLIGSADQARPPSPEQTARMLEATAELMDAFSIGGMEAADVSFAGGAGDDKVTGRIARLGFTGAAGGRGAEIKVEGLEAGGAKGRVRYGALTLGGLNIAPLFDVVRETAGRPEAAADPAVLRRLIPIIASLRLDDLSVDTSPEPTLSNQRGANSTGGGGSFGIGRFELSAEKPVNGIPTSLLFVVRNIAAPVPSASDNEGAVMLSSLGYERVDASLGVNLAWNEASQEIVLRDLSFDGKDMGTATLRALLGKVGRDVFDADTAVAAVAATGAVARSAELVLENRGLFERVIAREARKQKRSPEDVRREYGTAAAIGVPALLGNSPAVKTVAQALARFVAKPGKLTIQARAKGPGGFGLADFSANPNPAAVLDALEITAVAE